MKVRNMHLPRQNSAAGPSRLFDHVTEHIRQFRSARRASSRYVLQCQGSQLESLRNAQTKLDIRL